MFVRTFNIALRAVPHDASIYSTEQSALAPVLYLGLQFTPPALPPPTATRRFGPTALALALIGECVVIPWSVGHSLANQPIFAWISVVVLVGLAAWFPVGFAKSPQRVGWVAIALFPALLAITSLLTVGTTTFDALSRILAATTAVVYFVVVLIAHADSAPRYWLSVRALQDTRAPSRPPLAYVALSVLSLVALFLSVVAPAAIAANRPLLGATRYGLSLVRAQDAMVHGAGLALGVAVALIAGSRLLRGRGIQRSRRARALAWLIWALAFTALWWWFARLA